MSKIFISYRRDDAQGEAGHLMAELCRRYGNSNVFMDISAIAPGADFPHTIERAVTDSEIVLVLIGKAWLDLRNGLGQRRLDDPSDWVRLEIESALAQRRRLIPVLVQGSTMPREEALPVPMRPMARLNAHEISARRWDFDVQALMSALDPLLPDAAPSGRVTTTKANAISSSSFGPAADSWWRRLSLSALGCGASARHWVPTTDRLGILSSYGPASMCRL